MSNQNARIGQMIIIVFAIIIFFCDFMIQLRYTL